VHRDIKPANIHLGRLGLVSDFVKVLDFGLVKPASDKSLDYSPTTQAGLIMGTPGYMAPEMAISADIDGRADIYALGCVAYYLLTGKQVFEGTAPMQVMSQHLQSAPVAPSERAGIPLPAALDALVLACLAKKPADRPQDANVLALRLAAIDLPPWTETQAHEWWLAHAPELRPGNSSAETSVLANAASNEETRIAPRAFP
jgi:serine/threonine-protein kinase